MPGPPGRVADACQCFRTIAEQERYAEKRTMVRQFSPGEIEGIAITLLCDGQNFRAHAGRYAGAIANLAPRSAVPDGEIPDR